MKNLSILLIALLFFNCKNGPKTEITPLTANAIVNKSISVSGGQVYDSSSLVTIDFKFRGINYQATYSSKGKVLRRKMVKDNDTILDFLKGNHFQRYINEIPVQVVDSMIPRYSASVNSVHYFSVLPYGLNDRAVNKELIGEERIKNQDYYKIKVTFDEEGGGEDFDDVFIYWINKQNFKTDFLAYSYAEDDGQGLRFREAYNERFINGIRFVDYNNYKESEQFYGLDNLGKAFSEQSLKLLSKIELENIQIDLIDLQ